MFYKKAGLKNFAIFSGKHLWWSLFLIKLLAFRFPALLKRDCFVKHLRTAASEYDTVFVSLGLGLTTAALVLGIANFQKGNQARQQLMMRARVAAQGGTVLAMIGGLYMAAKRNSKYS